MVLYFWTLIECILLLCYCSCRGCVFVILYYRYSESSIIHKIVPPPTQINKWLSALSSTQQFHRHHHNHHRHHHHHHRHRYHRHERGYIYIYILLIVYDNSLD